MTMRPGTLDSVLLLVQGWKILQAILNENNASFAEWLAECGWVKLYHAICCPFGTWGQCVHYSHSTFPVKGLQLTVVACWHSWSSGSVRWAIQLLQCTEQLILLQPTAFATEAVLLMRNDNCEIVEVDLFLGTVFNLSCLFLKGSGPHPRKHG